MTAEEQNAAKPVESTGDRKPESEPPKPDPNLVSYVTRDRRGLEKEVVEWDDGDDR